MMRMVCDSTFILDQKSRFDTKIDEAMEIISTLLGSDDGKVVIFSQWERMLRILAQELEKKEIDFCFLHGGVPSVKRKNLIDRFRDDPDCRIFLSTDAGATGLNLQTASLLINLDLPWNPAVLEQRIARIYRLGQANPVQIINMVARDTIEERMLSTLRFKSNLAAGILDGGEDTIFLDNNKFDKVVEVVDSVINEPNASYENENQASDHEDGYDAALSIDHTDKPNTDIESLSLTANDKSDSEHLNDSGKTAGTISPSHSDRPTSEQNKGSNNSDLPHSGQSESERHNTSHNHPEDIRKTVAGGLEALGKIADMLRSPEQTNALVDAIVKEDPETGQTSLNIPVPDKSTVVNILSAFSAFLNR